VNVVFVPSTAHAATLLSAGLGGLSQALSQTGLTLGQAQVDGGALGNAAGNAGNAFGALAGQTGGQTGGQANGQAAQHQSGPGQPALRGAAQAYEQSAPTAGGLSAYA